MELLEGVKGRRERGTRGMWCLLGGLCLATLLVALLSLSLSLTVYLQHLHKVEERGGQLEPDQTALEELEAMFESEDQMHFDPHSRDTRGSNSLAEEAKDAGCNSTLTDADEKPLAHIVSDGRVRVPIPDSTKSHSIITKNWVCNKPGKTQRPSTYGRVRGGMFFNRSSGFLRLPRDGVYYVYSLVHFRGGSPRDSGGEKIIASKMVACVPDLECEFPEDSSLSHMHSERQLGSGPRAAVSNNFQGGLFYFPAGTQLALMVKNPRYQQTVAQQAQRDSLYLDGRWEYTYMGVFLVDEDRTPPHGNTTHSV